MNLGSSRARILLAVLLACALACADERHEPAPEPRWIPLTHGFRPRPVEELVGRLEASIQPPRSGRIVARDGELWFELPLPRDAWVEGENPYEWCTSVPRGGAMFVIETKSLELADGDHVRTQVPGHQLGPRVVATKFLIRDAQIVACLEKGPSDAMALRARLAHGAEVDGRWRSTQFDLACDGLLVFPGAPETLRCDVPPGSRLCFATVSPSPSGKGGELAPTTFRVKLGGRTVFEREQAHVRESRSDWHSVELAEPGPAELVFEVDGPAPSVFATPMLAPRDVGRPGARPWRDARPDLVLVLCDTFRADNLAAYGGDPALAPQLNAWVERSLRFLDARATAAWTLPSIGSILSGVFPGQHGGTDLNRGVVAEVETLAEVLGRAGYRTAAVTDSGLFSRHYGQDQGFEWFEESNDAAWSLAHTLQKSREQLERDDGRPLFLVLHTYRVHVPMRVGPDEDPKPWLDFLAQGRERRKANDEPTPPPQEGVDPEFQAVARRFYVDAVADLDRKVGAWIEELERDGFLAHGVLALTSDHGEAYGEHDQTGHGGDLFDVKLRVPLVFAGRGIEPRAASGVVSLVDLAPTFARLAGVAPSSTWLGRPLIREGIREGIGELATLPVYAFDLKKHNKQIALFVDGRKLMAKDLAALHNGRPSHAFDLARDPAEEHNLVEGHTWPAELGRALAKSVEPLLVPTSAAKTLELPPEVLEDLRDIGYTGDDEDEE